MTPEQKRAITACIEAFHIPRDCLDFTLTIKTDRRFDYAVDAYGTRPFIGAHLEVDHAPASPPEA
jgi:hypothetical protein